MNKWDVKSCDARDLQGLLDDGWDPFNVTQAYYATVIYHLKRLRQPDAAQAVKKQENWRQQVGRMSASFDTPGTIRSKE